MFVGIFSFTYNGTTLPMKPVTCDHITVNIRRRVIVVRKMWPELVRDHGISAIFVSPLLCSPLFSQRQARLEFLKFVS